jgi:hypothetical protein
MRYKKCWLVMLSNLISKTYQTTNCFYTVLTLLIISSNNLLSQNKPIPLNNSSVSMGFGLGFSNGNIKNGLCSNIFIAYQIHFGRKKQFSVGPFVSNGAYRALALPTDISSQSFKSTSLRVNTRDTLNFLTFGLGAY